MACDWLVTTRWARRHWPSTSSVIHFRERISPYNDATGMVVYRSKDIPSTRKGGRKNFQVFTAAEFIAAITQHIPDKSFQLVRY